MTYAEIQTMIDRIRSLGGTVNFCHPESMPQSICLIDWGLPLKKIVKTGYMPEILIQASDEFFKMIEEIIEEGIKEVEEESHAA